jgi:hypothetical protein
MLSPHSAVNRRASGLFRKVGLFISDVSAHYLTNPQGQEVEGFWSLPACVT